MPRKPSAFSEKKPVPQMSEKMKKIAAATAALQKKFGADFGVEEPKRGACSAEMRPFHNMWLVPFRKGIVGAGVALESVYP